MTKLIKIMFVCSQNISLSPMAAQIFLHLIRKQKIADRFSIESSALDFNAMTGLWLEPSAKEYLIKEGIDSGAHTSTIINADDSEKYDWVICMNDNERRKCLDIFKNNAVYVTPQDVRFVFKNDPAAPYSINGMIKPRVCCLMDFTGTPHNIVDPAVKGGNWKKAFEEVSEGCSALLELSPFIPKR